jgi:hypothetical protein
LLLVLMLAMELAGRGRAIAGIAARDAGEWQRDA